MFTKLCMVNFKSWQDTGEVPLAPLTGLFGANSSGKSSLLQMLLLLKQTTESNDRNLVLKTGTNQDGYVNLGTPHEITYGDENQMSFSVAWSLPSSSAGSLVVPVPKTDETVELNALEFFTSIHAEPQKIYVSELSYTHKDDFKATMSRSANNQYTLKIHVKGEEPNRPQGRPRVYMRPQKCYGFSDEALRFYQDTDYLDDIVLKFEQQFQNLHYLGPLREYPQRIYNWGGEKPTNVGLKGELTVPALLAAKGQAAYSGKGNKIKVEQRIAKWLVELGLAHSFKTHQIAQGRTQYEVRLKRHENSHEVLMTDLGIGVSQILPVLVLCYYVPQGSTIILEQPELHLHPSVQSGLADVFIDVIKNRNVQLIVESHSEHLIRRLQRRMAEGEIKTEDTALYFCEMEQGVSRIKALDIDDYGNIRNWPKDFFGDAAGDMVAMLDANIERQMNSNG